MFGIGKKSAGAFGAVAGAVGTVAPMLAKGLSFAGGGPIVGAAVKAICDIVGGDPNDPSSIEEALARADANALVELKKADARYQTELRKAEIDLDKAAIADTQDARRVHRESWVPSVVTMTLVFSFVFGLLAPLFMDNVDPETVENILLGIGPLAGGAVSYWLGSSRTQDAVTSRQAEVVVAR